MTSMVSWRDYENVSNFAGAATQNELQELNKALAAGSARDPSGPTPGDGFALRVESLESTLKNTTFRMEHVRMWRAIPKIPAYNTVEEYNQIQSYGNSELGAFMAEGALPEESDAQYERKYAYVKYLGVTRKVTHVMTLVRPAHGNVLAQETVTGTMRLLEQLERALFIADSNLDSLQFDGFERLIRDGAPDNIIDLRGKPLTEDNLTDAGLKIMDAPNYGIPTHFHTNPRVKADFVKTIFPRARFDQFSKTDQGLVGADIKGITTPAGDIEIVPNVFLDDGGGVAGLSAVGDATKRPGNPTLSTAVTSPADGASRFELPSEAGAYHYYVVAVNEYGQCTPFWVTSGGAHTVALGDKVTFGITPAAAGVKYYKVYRTVAGGAATTARLILRVPNAAGAGETIFNDYNVNLPGTFKGFMFQQNLDNMSFKQLAPMVKIPLATIDSSIRWMQLLYGVPVLYTPKHNVLIINIGRAPDFAA